MLHTETVESSTLEILKKLMTIPELSHFSLVGGTALSLLFGHRKSIDLDLFSVVEFDNASIVHVLEKNFPAFTYRTIANPVGLFSFIGNIKTDFVQHHYHPLINEINIIDRIRFMSTEDIAAMKLAAILRRAEKKDFWDIAELLKHYSVKQLADFHRAKYPTRQLLIGIPQALTYFDDAEDSPDPISLKGQTWQSIKKTIQKGVRDFLH